MVIYFTKYATMPYDDLMVAQIRKSSAVELIFSRDVAVILGKSVSQINRLAAAGELPTIGKTPGLRGVYLFDRDVIDDVAQQEGAK